jgi:hypothetical protein
MKKISKRLLAVIVLGMLMMAILPTVALANSAEPPSLVILINNPPDDLSITLVSNVNQPEARVRRVAWEGYYAFYSRDIKNDDMYTFMITTNGESFECTLSAPLLHHYNNVVTLDVSDRELTPGKYPFRSLLLVSIRLLLTLLIEGIIFWLFWFRQKRSWLIFLAINLVTQGILNIWLNSGGSLMPSYLIISLIIGEFFVFAAEMITFPIFIEEHNKSRSLIYAFIANLVSLIAGGYIISVLPV